MPTTARKISSIGYDVDSAEPTVAAAQIRMPAKITRRGPKRSAMGPEASDAKAKTSRFTVASIPSWTPDSLKLSPISGVMP